ncbi:hypothetical protein AWB76_02040 [Caballeronia temeraria]|uniref:Uncharacterized protein n=1 Tax=Caballeronia temeraria TaxID=1777137 RepID=A0A158AAD8_9BURK|nr:hypothetical protein [Caballeronia temeraria]SAK54655.1 hypothetical protein AWB76_02040 [Caballeronia temeraria]
MELSKKRSLVLTKLSSMLEAQGWIFFKTKSTFRKGSGDWVWECALNSIVRSGHVAFETKFFLSNRKVVSISKKICRNVVCPDVLLGGNVLAISDALGYELPGVGAEKILLPSDSAEIFCGEWFRMFEDIGVPFWSKFDSYLSMSEVFNCPPFDKLVPLVLSGANRVLRGPVIAYCAGATLSEMRELFRNHERLLGAIKMNGIQDDFAETERTLMALMVDKNN